MAQPNSNPEKPTVLRPVEARAGRLGRPVLVVLVVSMILAILGMWFSGLVQVG
jgi:hypothetical protein